MDSQTLDRWREVIRKSLIELAEIPYLDGVDIRKKPVFDEERNAWLVVVEGWEKTTRRMHGCVAHIELIGDKIWIQEDGTDYGLATEFVAAGVPKEHIVLGFKTPRTREYTEFAVA